MAWSKIGGVNSSRISRPLLVQRLRHLERAGVIRRITDAAGRSKAYHLTEAGLQLDRVIDALGDWGARLTIDSPAREELDPYLVLLWMSRHVEPAAFPPQRTPASIRLPAGPSEPVFGSCWRGEPPQSASRTRGSR